MTSAERKRASIDLTLTYFNSYYPDWRLAKVLTLKKLLATRYDFYRDIIPEVKYYHDQHDGDATIAQEIRNGLYFDAISQCVQYVEDLFALLHAAKTPDFFVRDIITYDAGKVVNLIKSFHAGVTPEKLAESFHFPNDLPFTEAEDRRQYDERVAYLHQLVRDVAKFHRDYEFFHNQYKHGLTVAMRPFGNAYGKEQIEEDKAGNFPPYLAAFDNLNLPNAGKKGRFRPEHGVIMPGFTDNVRPFIAALINEQNFIRLVNVPDIGLDIEALVDVAYKTRACINTFLSNYSSKIDPAKTEIEFQLPIDHRTTKSLQVKCRMED